MGTAKRRMLNFMSIMVSPLETRNQIGVAYMAINAVAIAVSYM